MIKRRFLLPLFGALWMTGGFALADDAVRTAQETLRDLGFYTGAVNGETNADTQGAIRRFQLYKGLEATGTLDDRTSAALHEEALAAPASSPGTRVEVAPPPPSTRASSPAPTPPRPSVQEEDRAFLDGPKPATPPPPSSGTRAGSVPYAVFYRDTPYATAPLEVQRDTLRRAQVQLARAGLYAASIDGVPGPGTEEALFRYQSRHGLERSGRLDLETLGSLNLLPRSRGPGARPVPPRGSTPDQLYYGRVPQGVPGAVPRGIRMD